MLERRSTPSAVALFWIGFSIVFAVIQLLSSSTLVLDTAGTVENVQRHLAGGYQLRNPPLFDWMYYFAQTIFDEGIVAHTVLRYVFFAAIGLFYYAAVRQVGCNPWLAAAFSYSLIFFTWMISDIHHHFTHTLPMMVFGLAAWITAVAYVNQPGAWRAALLGLLIGCGTISKWSFLLPVAGTFCAFVFDSRARGALWDRRSLLIPAFAVIPVAPVALWLARVGGDVVSVVHKGLVTEAVPYGQRVLPAIWKFLVSIVLYLLPWPIIVGWIGYVTRRHETPGPMQHAGRLAVSATLWTIGLGLAGVAALGVGNMGMRYMFPVLLTAPIAVAAWISVRVDDRSFARATINLATVVAVLAVVVRFWSFHILDGIMPQNKGQLYPYEALAQQLAARGFATAQFIAASERDAGNLMAQFPGARAVAVGGFRIEPPPLDPSPDRSCVALWGGAHKKLPERPSPPPPPEFLKAPLDAGAGPIEDIFVDWPKPLYGEERQFVWRILPLPEEWPACRAARGL
jgi:hypothetical protein